MAAGGAHGGAQAAGDALCLGDLELDAVLLALACEGGAAHGQVLDGAAEAGHLVALDVAQHDHAVGVQDAAGYLGRLEAGACGRQGYLAPVVALEAVGYEDGRPAHLGHEAVGYGRLQVVDGVGAAARVERVRVGEERLRALGSRQVRGGAGEHGADVGVVAYLAEMYLDGA